MGIPKGQTIVVIVIEVTEISALDDCGVYLIKAVDLSAGGNVEIFAEVTVNASRYNIGKFNKMLSIPL